MRNLKTISPPFPIADPRIYQISTLSALLFYGIHFLAFPVSYLQVALTLLAALLTQHVCSCLVDLSHIEYQSALISGLSLCLLLRTDEVGLVVPAAIITVASKFLLRINRKHVFNPSSIGLAAMLFFSDHVWLSTGQWGSVTLLALTIVGAGCYVLYRAARADIVIVFFTVYVSVVLLRSYYLGVPFTIPLHQLQNGALLLFGFFMISDPKTIPNARAARIGYAAWVALFGAYWQFFWYQPYGLLYALVLSAPLVPLLDSILPSIRYQWKCERSMSCS